MIYDI